MKTIREARRKNRIAAIIMFTIAIFGLVLIAAFPGNKWYIGTTVILLSPFVGILLGLLSSNIFIKKDKRRMKEISERSNPSKHQLPRRMVLEPKPVPEGFNVRYPQKNKHYYTTPNFARVQISRSTRVADSERSGFSIYALFGASAGASAREGRGETRMDHESLGKIALTNVGLYYTFEEYGRRLYYSNIREIQAIKKKKTIYLLTNHENVSSDFELHKITLKSVEERNLLFNFIFTFWDDYFKKQDKGKKGPKTKGKDKKETPKPKTPKKRKHVSFLEELGLEKLY